MAATREVKLGTHKVTCVRCATTMHEHGERAGQVSLCTACDTANVALCNQAIGNGVLRAKPIRVMHRYAA